LNGGGLTENHALIAAYYGSTSMLDGNGAEVDVEPKLLVDGAVDPLPIEKRGHERARTREEANHTPS
jgi:hypothetical protein